MKKSVICLSLIALAGCAELNDPYYSSPYPSYPSYDSHRDRDYYYERERERRERERWEREHHKYDHNYQNPPAYQPPPPPPPKPPAVQERCPSGFSPSERKCSQEERRRGCQDIRLNSGLGCVRR